MSNDSTRYARYARSERPALKPVGDVARVTYERCESSAGHEQKPPRRRRRTTPTTKPIAPISMEQIAEEFRKAMEESR